MATFNTQIPEPGRVQDCGECLTLKMDIWKEIGRFKIKTAAAGDNPTLYLDSLLQKLMNLVSGDNCFVPASEPASPPIISDVPIQSSAIAENQQDFMDHDDDFDDIETSQSDDDPNPYAKKYLWKSKTKKTENRIGRSGGGSQLSTFNDSQRTKMVKTIQSNKLKDVKRRRRRWQWVPKLSKTVVKLKNGTENQTKQNNIVATTKIPAPTTTIPIIIKPCQPPPDYSNVVVRNCHKNFDLKHTLGAQVELKRMKNPPFNVQIVNRTPVELVDSQVRVFSIPANPKGRKKRKIQVTGYECMVCKKFFKKRVVVTAHVRLSHFNERAQCVPCGRQFYAKQDARKHQVATGCYFSVRAGAEAGPEAGFAAGDPEIKDEWSILKNE